MPLARLRSLCDGPANHGHEVLVLVSCEAGEVAKLMGTAELQRRLLGVFVDLAPSQQVLSSPPKTAISYTNVVELHGGGIERFPIICAGLVPRVWRKARETRNRRFSMVKDDVDVSRWFEERRRDGVGSNEVQSGISESWGMSLN